VRKIAYITNNRKISDLEIIRSREGMLVKIQDFQHLLSK
jgi:hypothetical protein